MTTEAGRLTADDRIELPRGTGRRELIRGELREIAPAGNRHGKYAARIAGPLFAQVRTAGLGEVYVAEAGCRLVLVVNPRRRSVTDSRSRTDIAILTGEEVLDGGEVVPGWKLPLKDLFE